MSPIEEFFHSKNKPAAILIRDIRVQQLADSFEPLYTELCALAGCQSADLTSFIRGASDSALLDLALRFVHRAKLPPGCSPISGTGATMSNTWARRLTLLWSSHKNNSGGFQPYSRKCSAHASNYLKLPLSDRIAEYVASVWKSSRRLDYSWGAISRSAYDALEGSYRSHTGKMFEEAVREAVRQAVDDLFLPFKVSFRESVVMSGNGKKSRIDIVVDTGEDLILIPCKSTQLNNGGHATLFVRDVRDSLFSIGVAPERVLAVFGGDAWGHVLRDLPFRSVCIQDPFPLDDAMIIEIKNAILDTGILTDTPPRIGNEAA